MYIKNKGAHLLAEIVRKKNMICLYAWLILAVFDAFLAIISFVHRLGSLFYFLGIKLREMLISRI